MTRAEGVQHERSPCGRRVSSYVEQVGNQSTRVWDGKSSFMVATNKRHQRQLPSWPNDEPPRIHIGDWQGGYQAMKEYSLGPTAQGV